MSVTLGLTWASAPPEARSFPRQSGQEQRKFHILPCVENGDEVVELEDEPDAATPPGSQVGLGKGHDISAVDGNGTAVSLVDASNQIEKCCLA